MNKSFFCRVWIRFVQWIINHILKGTHAYSMKRMLLRSAGMKVGNGTQVVGPISFDFAHISIGENCWIAKDFEINGHGTVTIGNDVGIGPHTRIYTGKHLMGPPQKRHAGQNINTKVIIEDGVMIAAGSSIVGSVTIAEGAVAMIDSCVVKDVEKNAMVGGVPAKVIKIIE